MSPRVYRPDHTAHVRRRLAQMTAHGAFGLVVAAAAAGILAVIGSPPRRVERPDERSVGHRRGARAVTVLYLLVTLAAWLIYRRCRPDFDAAGAEIVGEFHARIANLHRDDTD